jgi:branched-chain amino acid transport system permease protein
MIEDATSYSLTGQGVNFFSISYVFPALTVGGVTLPITARLISLIAVTMLAVILQIVIRRTLTGKIIRALIQDREAAVSLGVNVERMSAITFGIGVALAAMAGLFMLLITSLTAYAGIELTIKSLTIIILGGLGSFPGSIIGAVILGMAESYASFYGGASWAPLVSLIILVLILLVRPRGLFGER